MSPKFVAAIACLAFAVFLSGCTPVSADQQKPTPVPATATPTPLLPTNTPAPDLFAIREISDLKVELAQVGLEQETVSNCGGTDTVVYTVVRQREFERNIELGGEITGEGEGKAEIFGSGVDLRLEIAAKLNIKYGLRDTLTRSIEISVKPGTQVQYEISLQEVYRVGTAFAGMGDLSSL